MNKLDSLSVLASRQTDALIAEKVMELRLDWEFAEFQNGEPAVPTLRDKYDEIGILPFYSTDISAAWDIVEKLKLTIEPSALNQWYVHKGIGSNGIYAETAPLAICRAALLYMSESKP